MSSDFLDWLDEDAGDRRVQRRLESELQGAYSYQASQSSALRSQLTQVTGSLEQRLNKLTEAFYAFVELSDLRAEQAVFEDEASVRHAALRLLRALLRRVSEPADVPAELPALPADLPPCHGYWLRPAIASLAASLAGDESAAMAAAAAAGRLDPLRTAVFRAAALALAGRAPLGGPLLAEALQEPGGRVSYAQRALWEACGRGVYGAPGLTLIQNWLAGPVRAADDAALTRQWASAAGTALAAGSRSRRTQPDLPRDLARNDALNRPLDAAAELSGLAVWVREAMTGGTPGAGPAADPPVTALGAVAAALTEEGSPEEVALARRVRELREIIGRSKSAARPSWDAEQDGLLPALCADAFGADLALRRVALRAGARWVTAHAGDLLKQATVTPPEQLTIEIDRHQVELTASGQASLKAAYAEIEQENAPQGISDKLFGKKHAAEETEREQHWVASSAESAAAAFAGRVTELRAAARQAVADHETVTAALA
jgi:hypothetical protein